MVMVIFRTADPPCPSLRVTVTVVLPTATPCTIKVVPSTMITAAMPVLAEMAVNVTGFPSGSENWRNTGWLSPTIMVMGDGSIVKVGF